MGKLIAGIILVGLAYISVETYAPVLFVQGMVLINFAIYDWGKFKSIEHR